ncbi:NAD(P)/FAD-dependent oxidoreductase [Pantanalinema sp. GBBB05]|uniref:NAD(P)/FAD-dependent oxidoreductase n=1 Tax=Pantanalinema sp. GBBB05 TaxID=2604139 RepID=UPI001DA97BE7|nr:NAD(P)/FAD-dependent oxidoreductase [Pantanalinema sp. GBBB05]
MKFYETIIVGGGPAGSSCAWRLQQHGREVLVIDKDPFPRVKLCAGWISAAVLKHLEFTPEQYPHAMLKLQPKMYVAPIPFPIVGSWATAWRADYSIRRVEFDHWLLQRSQAPVVTHTVKKIEQQDDRYILDHQYMCRYLVGAGGTACPVRRRFFPEQRAKTAQILTQEKEFEYPQRDDFTHLFFRFHGLGGYAWYVPKGNGFLNIGLGGYSSYFAKSKTSIQQHFRWFLNDLVDRKLLDQATAQSVSVSSHGYYVFTESGAVKQDNCFLIGDSAGLASVDLGEGISPAVESGLLVANDIMGQGQYNKAVLCSKPRFPALALRSYIKA